MNKRSSCVSSSGAFSVPPGCGSPCAWWAAAPQAARRYYLALTNQGSASSPSSATTAGWNETVDQPHAYLLPWLIYHMLDWSFQSEGGVLPFFHRSVRRSRCTSRWRIRCRRSTGTTRCCYSCCVGKQAQAPSDSAGSDTWPQVDLPSHSAGPPVRQRQRSRWRVQHDFDERTWCWYNYVMSFLICALLSLIYH